MPIDAAVIPQSVLPPVMTATTNNFRALFFSDLHLGSLGSKAETFLNCLRELTTNANKPKKIYIVGDFVELLIKVQFTEADIAVIDKLIDLADSGIQIRIIKGNHDQTIEEFARCAHEVTGDDYDRAMRQRLARLFEHPKVKVKNKRTHTAADGKGYRVTHAHEFDPIIRAGNLFGLWGKTVSKTLCDKLDCRGTRLKEPFFKLSAWIARRLTDKFSLAKFVNNVGFGGSFILPTLVFASLESTNDRIQHDAANGIPNGRTEPYDGHILGHEHKARMLQKGKLSYINIGDFVGNDTFAAEAQDGSIALYRWTEKGVQPFVNPTQRIPKRVGADYINTAPPVLHP